MQEVVLLAWIVERYRNNLEESACIYFKERFHEVFIRDQIENLMNNIFP